MLELVSEISESPAALSNRIKEFFDIICLWEEIFNPYFDPEERGYEGAIRPTLIRTWQQRRESFVRLSQLSDAFLIMTEEKYHLENSNLILDARNACELLFREMCSDRDKDHYMKGVEEAKHLSKCFGMARPILERLERTHLARSFEAPSASNQDTDQSRPTRRGATTDQLMMTKWRDNHDAVTWIAKQWASAIGKSETSIKSSKTWSNIMADRERMKAARQEMQSSEVRHYDENE